jgi:phage terminase large subunit
MILNIDGTPVFERNWETFNNPQIKTIINQGGSRSSKTYSIVQILILIAMTTPGQSISIVRKSFPSLRSSVMRDWKEIMFAWDVYEEDRHSKTEHTYTFENGSTIEFFSLDDSQKVRGRKRDILYCNEANEIDQDSWIQLKMRTTGKVFIDYNPSAQEHWCYDLINEDSTLLIKSTYLDNPFLSKDQVKYIEDLIKVDEDYYKIYALGERVAPRSLVYNHFVKFDHLPPTEEILDVSYGLDIGYNHETAFVEVTFATDNRLYIREMFYKNEVTGEDIVRLIGESNYDRTKMIYVDSARPDLIESMRRKGIRGSLSDKRVKEGIDYMKSKQVLININSENIWRESRMYSWKETKDGVITDEIVKKYDDALDAIRYAAFTHGKKIGRSAIPFSFGGR